MSTPHTIRGAAPRFQIRPAALGTALGVLVAIAVSVAIVALTGAHRTTAASQVTASPATSGSVPQVRYLGPRQVRAGLVSRTARVRSDATSPAADASNRAPQYSCLPEKFCIRVR
jgi:hypothetical protein